MMELVDISDFAEKNLHLLLKIDVKFLNGNSIDIRIENL